MSWNHLAQDDRVRETWFPVTLSNVPVWNRFEERASHTWAGAGPPESARQHQQAAQSWGIIFTRACAEASHPGEVCISANHENHLHVFPGLSHCSIWPQYFNLFHHHLQSDLWLHPKSQLVHLCGAHNRRPQVSHNCWILNIHGTTHPDLPPLCWNKARPKDFATRIILWRLSCPPGRRVQRLASQDEKEPTPPQKRSPPYLQSPMFCSTWWL